MLPKFLLLSIVIILRPSNRCQTCWQKSSIQEKKDKSKRNSLEYVHWLRQDEILNTDQLCRVARVNIITKTNCCPSLASNMEIFTKCVKSAKLVVILTEDGCDGEYISEDDNTPAKKDHSILLMLYQSRLRIIIKPH